MLKKYRHVLFTFTLATAFSFVLVYLAVNDTFANFKLPFNGQAEVDSITEISTAYGQAEYLVKYKYLVCGHTVIGELPPEVQDLELKSIKEVLESDDGWAVNTKDNITEFTKYIDGFCPADASKTHLGSVGKLVAVFQGPPGINTHIKQITDIPVANLPFDWQEQVRQGELDFDSVTRLKETLDSLDEYQ